jgi:hypothetical protein
MARRRFKRAGFNQKLIMDVGLAGIAVRVIPILLNKFVPLDPTIYTVAGAGGGWLVGSMLKKPDLANASIALGLVEFAAPMIENLIGGIGTPAGLIPVSGGVKPMPPMKVAPTYALDDYLRLNDYIENPGVRQGVQEYRSSY